jgi:hypothetical protein
MRRFWMMLLTISVVLVIALPAGVAKPGKPPKPPKAEPIAVSLDANPMSVHEGADIISYTVTLENTTRDTIDGHVKFSAAGSDDVPKVFSIGAKKDATVDFSRTVREFEEAGPCLVADPPGSWPDECALLATAEVLIGENLLKQVTMSTPLVPYPSCGFKYDNNFVSNSVPVSDICIWTLPPNGELTKTGVWEITLAPTPPDKLKRNFTAAVSVRDHVPGNWCSLAIDGSWGFGERWRDGDDPIDGGVYLPGVENFLELGLGDGVCLAGGAGGDYFAVGNPDSFYLRANGDVTVRWDRPLP